MSDCKKKEFHYGGQAVIEGVMMRGPKDFAVAVRNADGEIVTSKENVESILGKFKWLDKPLLRGTLALIDAMALGIKALKFSADVAMADAANSGQADGEDGKQKPQEKVNDITVGIAMALGLLGGVSLFLLVPILITKPLGAYIHKGWELTLVEGVIKIGIFIGYVALISLMKDVRRVFQYHGAEHKTINAYEAKEELTVENVRNYTKVHVRCGTSFLLVVLVSSIVVMMVIADQLPYGSLANKDAVSYLVRWVYKLILLPFVAGIAYEVIKFAGNRKSSWMTTALTFPGLLMQKITTREPDDQMIEVAIKSLQGVLEREHEHEDDICEADEVTQIEID